MATVKLSVHVKKKFNKGYILGQRNVPPAYSEAPPLPCVSESGWRSLGLPEINLDEREEG